MNKEEPYRDQAERLRQRIEKINEEKPVDREQLPPREQIHRQKRQKTKWKLKYPVIRLLALIFILLPIIIFSIISLKNEKKLGDVEKTSGNTSGYETINLETPKTDDNLDTLDEEKEKDEMDDLKTEGENLDSVDQEPVNQDAVVEGQGTNEDSTIELDADKNSGGQTGTTGTTTGLQTASANPSNSIYHTVQPKENLYRISLKYYKSKAGEDIIKKANNLKNENVYVGQVLKIPLNTTK